MYIYSLRRALIGGLETVDTPAASRVRSLTVQADMVLSNSCKAILLYVPWDGHAALYASRLKMEKVFVMPTLE